MSVRRAAPLALAGLCLGAAPGLCLCAAPSAAVQGEDSPLASALADVDEDLARARYTQATAGLLALIEEHGHEPEAWRLRPRILERLVQAAQGDALAAPDPEELIPGDVRKYSERTGSLKVVHEPRDLERAYEPVDLRGDYGGRKNPFLLYPTPFSGPFSVEVTLARPPQRGKEPFSLVVVMPDNHRLQVRASKTAISLDHFKGTWETLDRYFLEDLAGPLRLELKVENSTATVFLDGKRVVRGRKPTGLFGRFALAPRDGLTQVVVEGRVERSWVQGLRDAHLARQRAEFLARWKPSIPPSFRVQPSSGAPVGSVDPLPAELEEEPARVLRSSLRVFEDGERERFLEAARALTEGAAEPPAVRDYATAWASYHLGDWENARRACDALVARRPGYAPGRKLRALIASESGELALARTLLAQLVDELPDETWALSLAARVELSAGDHAAADAVIERAIEARRYDARLAEVHTSLMKARSGPRWAQVFEVRSEHYVVRTDLDRKTAREALDLLEAARGHFATLLGASPPADTPPAAVYLFSGQAGYLDYIDGVSGSRPESTAGLYSPVLDQLLVWNLPEREEMFRTVRHEGFHQFARHALPELPMWLNEGLAELFEGADFTRVRSHRYGPQVGHLAVLRTLFPGPLDTPLGVSLREQLAWTVEADRAAFYGPGVELHYAVAWLLAHHLVNSGPDGRALLNETVRRLGRGAGSAAVTSELFTDEVLEELRVGLYATYRELVEVVTTR